VTVKWLDSSALRTDARYRAAAATAAHLRVYLGGLVVLALLVPLQGLWAAQLLLVPLLLTVPGLILLRALRVPAKAIASFPAYVPCASLVVLLASGLAVDLTGLVTGMAAPLRTGPLLVGLELICLALLASSVNAPSRVAIRWRVPARPLRLALPLILPLVAAAGALRLNSGHGDAVAVLSLVACIVLLITALVQAASLEPAELAVIVYAAGLALMWSFSLRGNLVYGFDIATEYHAMQQTLLSGVWHPAHPGNAYAALLSVTVLPTELHAISGVPGLLVFKVVFPAIAALFPVAVFGLARRILERRWAFAAAAFILMQATFFQTLPALARQEIGLLLFAALLMAILDTRLARWPQWTLAGLFALGMAVSHYSTTYLAIAIFGLALPLQFAASWIRPVPRVTWPILVAFAGAVVGALLWYGPVTQSASNLAQVASTAQTEGLRVLPSAHAGNLLAAYLQSTSSPPLTPAQYAQLAHQYYAAHVRYVTPLPDAASPQYSLRAPVNRSPPVRWPGGYGLLDLASLIVTQLTNLLAAVGAVLILLWRRSSVVARQVGVLAIATVVILTVARLSGTVAQVYSPERAFLQTMVVLAITMVWPLQWLASKRNWRLKWLARNRDWLRKGVLVAAGAALAIFFVGSTGLAQPVLGGGAAANLANSGADYNHFVMTTPELASARWLFATAQPGQLIYADRYAQLRLFTVAGLPRGLVPDVTPRTINQHAWVYANRPDVVDGEADTTFNNRPVSYAFPFGFLDNNFDTVYTNGSSEVFRR
jgi:uncharacterized membrane protein